MKIIGKERRREGIVFIETVRDKCGRRACESCVGEDGIDTLPWVFRTSTSVSANIYLAWIGVFSQVTFRRYCTVIVPCQRTCLCPNILKLFFFFFFFSRPTHAKDEQ